MDEKIETKAPGIALNTPSAIVIAGVFIAAGVYLGLHDKAPSVATPSATPVAFLAEENLPKHAKAAGVADSKAFASCLQQRKYDQVITKDLADAQTAGGQGTPYSVLIGSTGQKVPINGAQPFTVVSGYIDTLLAGKKVEIPKPTDGSQPAHITFRPIDASDHTRGPENAKITLIEYSDIQCPFCQKFHPVVKQILDKYPNDVRWAYRHFPLEQIHPYARIAANAVECASEQGKFWELTDYLFEKGATGG